MERKEIKIGIRVRPSDRGRGFVRGGIAGTVIRAGKNLITVKWDDGIEQGIFRPMHLEPSEK